MAGQTTGKDAAVLVSGREISTDLNTFTVTRNAETPDSTTFQSSTRTRVAGGIKDWNIELSGFFNDNTGAVEQQMQSLMGASAIVGVFPHGVLAAATCDIGYEGESIAPEMTLGAPVDNVVTIDAAWSACGDVYRGFILRPLSACTASDNSNSRDYAGSTAGATAILRVTAASGTTPTLDVALQESNDDSAWTNLATFTQVTAGSVAQIIKATSASRYRRFNWTIAGVGADFTFMATCTET
jgi:hypothetical protein